MSQINSHFLIGPEGAHLNISGISGLATKTSYAMFLLKAIQEKFKSRNFDNIEDKNQSVAFVLFNVKGRDLLSINEANGDLSPDDKKMYKEMHLSGLPFENVKFYYPYSKNQSTCNVQSYGDTDDICRQIDRNEAFRYKYVFCHDKENIDLLMANEDDTTGTIESIVNVIMNGVGEFSEVQTWKTLKDVIKEKGEKTNEKDAYGIMISSWRKFRRIINNVLDNDIFMPDKRDGNNEVYLSDEIKAIKKNDVMVIDIAQLDEDAQSFVFGDVIRSIKNMKLLKERKDIPSKIIIFVDELNK